MFILPRILLFYLSRLYCRYFFLVCIILCAILFVSTIFDTLYRFKQSYLPISIFIKLSLLKLPYLLDEILALVNLISTLLLFRYLLRNQELIIIFSSGISIYRIIISLSSLCIIISATVLLCINPISSTLLAKHAALERSIKNNSLYSKNVELMNSQGVIITEKYDKEKRVIIAQNISVASNTINKVTILFTNLNDHFIKRLDAEYTKLDNDNLIMHNVSMVDQQGILKQEPLFTVKTKLTINDFITKNIPPEQVPVSQLPAFINKLIKLGIPSEKYIVYFYKEIYKPIYIVTTLLLAFCFFRPESRNYNSWKNIAYGVICGFAIHSIKEVVALSLINNGIPIYLSMLIPIILIALTSLILILHLYV